MSIDPKELQKICDAQIEQIFCLKSEIHSHKQEIANLKSQIHVSPVISTDTVITDEEFIAINELKKLKFKSQTEDLTYEDAKRVELYFKVLNTIKNPKTKEEDLDKPKKYSTDELLSQIQVDKLV